MKIRKTLSGTCAAAALLAGCGTASPGTSSPATSTAASPEASASASASPPAQGSAAVAACLAGGLKLAQLPKSGAAAGTVLIGIQLTNSTAASCTLAGYPAFTLSLQSGGQVKVTVQPGQMGGVPAFAAAPTPVTVPAGGTAGFLVAYSNVPTGDRTSCDTATSMHLQLPGSGGTVTGTVRMAVCGGPVQASPYVPSAKLVIG